MKLTRRLLSILLGICLLVPITSLIVVATGNTTVSVSAEKTMRLYYDEPAELTPTNNRYTEGWDGWHSSLPLGNGYVGATVFGGTERERIQITEKSFFASSTAYIDNCFSGGLENFAETYLEFNHPFGEVSNYERVLTLEDAVAKVSYDYNGVSYTREIFTSYPDRVIAIHLEASEAGALNFVLSPEIPYLRDEADVAASEHYSTGMTKSGTVVADAQNATVTLSGTAAYYNLNYEALYRVESDGEAIADNSGEFGKLSISGATEATIYVACGTNYVLAPETFTESRVNKLDPTVCPHDELVATLDAIQDDEYQAVRARHVADHDSLYGNVDIDLGGTMPSITTDEMLYQYKLGNFKNNYIFELYYQIGRYFEVASSRDGTLPSNLMGAWCVYQFAPWTGGNWYNINEQMNYWGVFAANLVETFEAYLQFNEARMEQAKANADAYVKACNPKNYTEPGTNGWLVGTGNSPYSVGSSSPTGHSGVGTVGMTTIDYWNYYLFTMDDEALYESIFTVLQESARFYTKFAVLDENGLYLCTPSASPEQKVNGNSYITVGCAFDQQMMYENNFNYIKAVEIVRAYEARNGITDSIIDEALLATVNEQIDLYDPVIVGLSGQIKEYREEDYYGEIGEIAHRHISQLMGVANGTQINANTPAWLDAARTTLILRKSLESGSVGWGDAQRMFAFARCGDGESAMLILKRLASSNLYNNMWNNHARCYQTDGNFGVMAAISEMLLQSHDGYLNLLPAISDEFKNGSFNGILARGNFTVDLAWENGAPTVLTVYSGSGADLGIYYPAYTDISITDASGNAVAFTIEDGIIRLATEKGETYTVKGFTPKAKAKMANNLTATNDHNTVTLTWSASESANATYNVYRAYESSPTYTYLGTTSALTFTDTTKDDRQATYCVKAFNDETIESIGAVTTVIATPAAPQNATLSTLEGAKVQLEWDSVPNAKSYRVYKNGALVCETPLTVAVAEGSGAYTVTTVYYAQESQAASFTPATGAVIDKSELCEGYLFVVDTLGSSTFYDSTINIDKELEIVRQTLCDRDAGENEIAEAKATLRSAKNTVLYSKRNLAPSVKSYSISPEEYSDIYLKEYMIDGDISSRYATKRIGSTSIIVAEFDLGGVFSISEIDIYEFANAGVPRSETTQIEFFVHGKWVDALSKTATTALGTGSASNFHANVKTDASLEATKVRLRLERLSDGSNNLSIWELQIWGNNFNINGSIGTPVFNAQKPTSTNFTVSENFQNGSATYTDRTGATNYMSAIHVGEALKGLKQIRLPIADSSRTSNAELQSFLKGDNVYFTFEAECDGTVYVAFTTPLINYTAEKGWRTLADGAKLTLPSGESLSTLDPSYSDPALPYYLSRLQSNLNTGSVTGVVPFTYCYALDFKAGDVVEIPTPAVSNGTTNENLVVLVDCEPLTPFISSLSVNGEHFAADEKDTFLVRVPENTTTVELEALVLSDDWKCSIEPSTNLTLSSDYTTLSATVTDATTTRTYKIVLVRTRSSLLDGVTGVFEGAHYEGYFASNDIQGNVNKLTDKDETTFLQVWHSVPKAGELIFKYELGAYYSVDTFSIQATAIDGVSMLGQIKVEGYVSGKWIVLTTIDMPSVGTANASLASAIVTLPTATKVSALRFICGYNPAILTNNATSLSGKSLCIYEINASCENFEISAPELDSITVNGNKATLGEDGIYYASVQESVKTLTIAAMATDASTTVTISPSSTVSFSGKKKTLAVTLTNVLGESKTYTLVVEPTTETKNVLLGVTPSFTVGSGTYTDYPLSYVNDGNHSTRLACGQKSAYEIEFVLDGTYDLTEMRFNAYVHGTDTLTGMVTVRALIGDQWVDIALCDTASNYENYNANKNSGYTRFALNAKGVRAIRVYIEQNPNLLDKAPSIWEIDVQGTPSKAQPSNLLLGTTPTQLSGGTTHSGYPATNMTDGNTDSRLAHQDSTNDVEYEFVLGGRYDLLSLTVYTWADSGVSRTATVRVTGLVNGEWIELGSTDMREGNTKISNSKLYKSFALNASGVEAVRVYFEKNLDGTKKGQSIYEVILMGYETPVVEEESLFEEYPIYTSVTIHNSFDVNVYLPALDALTSVTLAGKTYDLTTLVPIEMNGNLYYKLSVGVDAKKGCERYELTLTLTIGDKQETKSISISLVRYLATLLRSDESAEEKALAIEVVAYVRAAILYFNNGITEEDAGYDAYTKAITELDALLTKYGYTETEPESLKAPADATASYEGVAHAAFSLDASVSFVLELEEGYRAEDFEFRVGGAYADVKLRDGYVFVTVKAYRITDTLTWTLTDKNDASITHTGEFSLAAYYASETVQKSPTLIQLVERLAAFSEAADAFVNF